MFASRTTQATRMVKALRLFRIARMLRISKIKIMLEKYSDSLDFQPILKLVMTIFSMLLKCHVLEPGGVTLFNTFVLIHPAGPTLSGDDHLLHPARRPHARMRLVLRRLPARNRPERPQYLRCVTQNSN